ncbi:hypothetical protein BV242_07795 [Lactiplantibacillus plantarum]|nr:hypothetical protein [Lactiplantibacillus plantarum]AGL64719.2 hypothetical protein LBP_cg1973 [Lactiplantibacillus plantarum subsp. plantarum P-8]MBR7567629.1 hypothetical protein [Lactiplantibacillus plantarum]MBR7624249.1 hypothetical protein [Lactiplantibacillus plantarum]MBR7625940.1 hypothetical protein [Lactiplantibacillus plantarum]MBR7645128.1 hypothetical protein [Lactiplantibacillus plantarum]
MFIYIKYDADGFITAYQNIEADGFTKVFILDSWITQFAQHSDKFRYDTDKKVILNPGNLPDLSLNELNTKYSDVLKTSQQAVQSATTLAQQQTVSETSINQLQKSITELALSQSAKGTA